MKDINLKDYSNSNLHPDKKDSLADDLTIEQAETLLSSMNDLVFVLDDDTIFLKCFQPQSSDLLLPADLFLGKKVADLPFPKDVLNAMLQSFAKAAVSGVTQTLNYCLPINNQVKWFNSRISRFTTAEGTGGFIVVARDITDWHINLQQLEANEKKYHLLADNTTDLVVLYSPKGIIEYISPSVYSLLGYVPESLIGIDPSAYIHPSDLVNISEYFQAEFYTKDSFFSAEYRLLHTDGRWVNFCTDRKPIRNEKGDITHIIACCRDITEKVQSAEALKKSEAHYKMLADNIIDLIGLHDMKGLFEYVSPSSLAVLGYMPEELIGRNAFDLIHPEESARLFENNRIKVSQGQDTFIDEFRILHKQGHYVHFESTTKIIRNAEHHPIKFLSTSRDITEWKQAQSALMESEEKYRGLVENSDNIIAMIDKDNRYLFVNSQAAAFIGSKAEDIIGRKLGEILFSGQEQVLIQNIQQVIAEERTIRSEDTLIIRGIQYSLRTSNHPIRNSKGEIYAVLLNAIDITNLKRTESLLEEQNKGLREIAFLQSHVLRSPLSNIKHLISMLDKKSLSEENKIILDLLQTSADNLDDVVKQIVEKTYLSGT